VFHAAEYQISTQSFDAKVQSIAKQLILFIQQFLRTYENIGEMDVRVLDPIVCGNEELCFDAQIEGRYLVALMIKLIALHQYPLEKHEEFRHERKRLSLEIRALADRMSILPVDLTKKLLFTAKCLALTAELIPAIEDALFPTASDVGTAEVLTSYPSKGMRPF
jgi:hypothetical protein